MSDVYIINGLRSYIGLKDRAYKNIAAEDLGAQILKELDSKNKILDIKTELVVVGNCVGGGGNIARLALLKAGFSDEVAGMTVDAQCASSLESLVTAFARIKSGINSAVLAGGMESTSTQCLRVYNPNHPNYDSTTDSDNTYTVAQFIPEFYGNEAMIAGADETCKKNDITVDDMAPYVIESHLRAAKKCNEGALKKYIHPIFNLFKDESIREGLSENFIKRLRPILKNGIINSATSCLMQDAAAFLTVVDESILNNVYANGYTGSVFKIRSAVTVGGVRIRSPESLFIAIDSLIKKSGLDMGQIDRIDYNQAFACIDVLYHKRYSSKSNYFGGALAYGHPYGASGAILTLHLMAALEMNDERFGICSIPAAGGIASAILLERIK